jgi:hypothetical protein
MRCPKKGVEFRRPKRKSEEWNAEESLRDDQPLLCKNTQLHPLSQIGGGKVGRRSGMLRGENGEYEISS